MKHNTTTLKGNSPGTFLSEANEKDEVALTTSPVNDNLAVAHELNEQNECNNTSTKVTTEELHITKIWIAPLLKNQTLVKQKSEAPDLHSNGVPEVESDEIAAEEIVAKHAEQAPSEKNGSSSNKIVVDFKSSKKI